MTFHWTWIKLWLPTLVLHDLLLPFLLTLSYATLPSLAMLLATLAYWLFLEHAELSPRPETQTGRFLWLECFPQVFTWLVPCNPLGHSLNISASESPSTVILMELLLLNHSFLFISSVAIITTYNYFFLLFTIEFQHLSQCRVNTQ